MQMQLNAMANKYFYGIDTDKISSCYICVGCHLEVHPRKMVFILYKNREYVSLKYLSLIIRQIHNDRNDTNTENC
jgi:hypothetical protein